jgi:prevent-host-death family protein
MVGWGEDWGAGFGGHFSAPSHICHACSVTEVASGGLRDDTRGLLRRVAAGENIIITVDGHPVAALRPLRERPRWVTGADFARRLARRQADPGLLAELQGLMPETTDDLPL